MYWWSVSSIKTGPTLALFRAKPFWARNHSWTPSKSFVCNVQSQNPGREQGARNSTLIPYSVLKYYQKKCWKKTVVVQECSCCKILPWLSKQLLFICCQSQESTLTWLRYKYMCFLPWFHAELAFNFPSTWCGCLHCRPSSLVDITNPLQSVSLFAI